MIKRFTKFKVIVNTQINFIMLLLFSIIIITTIVNAKDVSEYNYGFIKNIDYDVVISNEFKIIGNINNVKKLNVNLFDFPKEDYRQKIILSNPKILSDKIVFSLTKDIKSNNKVESRIKLNINNERLKVNEKIVFPLDLSNEPENVTKYVKYTDNINFDENIKEKALELSKNSDDLYEVVSNIGEWVVNNVDYKMTSETQNYVKSASWVFKNKIGVCDEMTSLFMSMLRSINIPVRYVSGFAYTNYNNINNFGSHAWAEVYFPNIGWIPFDVTYDQLGYVDSSHIKFNTNIDSSAPSINYDGKGTGFTIIPDKIDVNIRVDKDYNEKVKQDSTIKGDLIYSQVGFGSYNAIVIKINNLEDFYITKTIKISKIKGINFLDGETRHITLKPKQIGTVYFIFKIDDNLDKTNRYTFPITVYDSFNYDNKFDVNLDVQKNYNIYLKKDIEKEMSIYESKIKDNLGISVKCSTKNEISINENIDVKCVVNNEGNKDLNLNLIVNSKEIPFNISKKSQKEFEFNFVRNLTGTYPFKVVVKKNKDVLNYDLLKIVVSGNPKYKLDLNAPKSIKYGKKDKIEVVISKLDDENIKNRKLIFKYKKYSQSWDIDDTITSNLDIEIDGSQLTDKDNIFQFELWTTDKFGNVHKTYAQTNILVEYNGFFEWLRLFINRFV